MDEQIQLISLMNYRNLIVFIISALWVSCLNKADNKNLSNKDSTIVQTKLDESINDSNVYDDFDLFRLEGLSKIERPAGYPYIKIKEISNNEKRIVYKSSNKDSTESQ